MSIAYKKPSRVKKTHIDGMGFSLSKGENMVIFVIFSDDGINAVLHIDFD